MTHEIQLGKTDSQQEQQVLRAFNFRFQVGLEEHNDNHIIYLRGTYDEYHDACEVLQLAGL